jgi:hypothetical protein
LCVPHAGRLLVDDARFDTLARVLGTRLWQLAGLGVADLKLHHRPCSWQGSPAALVPGPEEGRPLT